MRDFLVTRNLLPTFTEETIFLTLIALGLIYYNNPTTQTEIVAILEHVQKVAAIAVIGALFTLYTAFFTQFKTETQKHYMIMFALIINGAVGITVLQTISQEHSNPLWYIFPILNLISVGFAILLRYTNLYNLTALTITSVSYSNIFYGSILLCGITYFLQHIPGMHWQVIFSSSIVYATYLSTIISRFLPSITHPEKTPTTRTVHLIEKATNDTLRILNRTGFQNNLLMMVTDHHTTSMEIPYEGLLDIDAYIRKMVDTTFRTTDVAIVTMGRYDWKMAWWGKHRSFQALIIDVFLANESTRAEFCQTMDTASGNYVIGEKGLIFLNTQTRS